MTFFWGAIGRGKEWHLLPEESLAPSGVPELRSQEVPGKPVSEIWRSNVCCVSVFLETSLGAHVKP